MSKEKAKYFEKTFGIDTKRRAFQNHENYLQIPNLLEIQEKSFQEFLDTGVKEVFDEIYPIESNKGDIKIDYEGHTVKLPSDPFQELKLSKEKGSNYVAPLYVNLKLTNLRTGEIKKSEVHFVDLPLMVKGGSFIINGSERVIISQILRSPGVYFEEMKASGSQSGSDDSIFNTANIVPNRGSWIEFDYKDYKLMKTKAQTVKVRVDKSKRISSALLFSAFGLDEETMLSLFSNNPLIINTIDKLKKPFQDPYQARKEIFRILNPGDRITEKSVNNVLGFTLFNRKRYDLSKTGRYKLNNKLVVTARILDRVLAEDIKDAKGKVIFTKGTLMDVQNIDILDEKIKSNNVELSTVDAIDTSLYSFGGKENEKLQTRNKLHIVKVYQNENYDQEENPRVLTVVGVDQTTDELFLTIPDIIATFSHMINLDDGLGSYDDIDSLSNRRIRTTCELLVNQLRIGMSRVEKNTKERISAKDISAVSVKNVTNNKLIKAAFREFFNSSQLSQFMDQVNPLAELSNTRRITALGPGGLSRDTASLVVRGIHDTHYGRICPIETPEGPNIGLILNLALYAQVDEYGFIRTPYTKVVDGKVTNETVHLLADDEKKYFIAQKATNTDAKGNITDKEVITRHNGRFISVPASEVTHIDVSPKQIVSLATSCIPFLENDDANRALMGANMQRQALPLIDVNAPVVATGSEELVAKYVSTSVRANKKGVVEYVDGNKVDVKYDGDKKSTSHILTKFERSNQTTTVNQVPKVKIGQKVQAEDILADGPAIDNGELALGQNVLVAFTTWNGYNYEDAIAISSRLVEDDVYTSMHIEEYTIDSRKTRIGAETITPEIPNASRHAKRNLTSEGIVAIGSEVKVGDILVGKITPKGEDELTPEEKLLDTILGNKVKNMRDSSLRVKNGGEGIVHDIRILDREKGDKLDDGVNQRIKIYIAKKRKIKVGDKMAGRHGNKGVISIVLPKEDMPHLEDGTPVDIMLNPLGVPSRMNIGQVLELHLGMAARKLNIKVAVPAFDGEDSHSLKSTMEEAGMDPSGKTTLINGITGEKFDSEVSVGVMYMLKLSHMVDDKMHSRSVGPYSLITQQPLGGKSQNGGQRFGEMEAWALEGYGASNLLQEMFTLKSDDIKGRNELFNAIANGTQTPEPNLPEGFWVLNYELRGLGMNMEVLDDDGNAIPFDKNGKEIKEEE